MFKRKTDRDKRDDAISRASDLMHYAARELARANYYASQMGDLRFATALWEIRDLIPAVTREVDAYLYPWQAAIQPPRYQPAIPVRQQTRT